MIRIAGLLLILPVLTIAAIVANDGWALSLVETLVAVLVIVGFAVAAVGWTIRRDV